jgi:hypothetical protein
MFTVTNKERERLYYLDLRLLAPEVDVYNVQKASVLQHQSSLAHQLTTRAPIRQSLAVETFVATTARNSFQTPRTPSTSIARQSFVFDKVGNIVLVLCEDLDWMLELWLPIVQRGVIVPSVVLLGKRSVQFGKCLLLLFIQKDFIAQGKIAKGSLHKLCSLLRSHLRVRSRFLRS